MLKPDISAKRGMVTSILTCVGLDIIHCLVPVHLTVKDTLYLAICRFLEVSLFY